MSGQVLRGVRVLFEIEDRVLIIDFACWYCDFISRWFKLVFEYLRLVLVFQIHTALTGRYGLCWLFL